MLSYDGGELSYYGGNLNVGFIYTMNAGKDYYEKNLRQMLQVAEDTSVMFFKGQVKSYASCDTLQVKDYSKYSMGAFDEKAKKQHREEQFPVNLEECFTMGVELSK